MSCRTAARAPPVVRVAARVTSARRAVGALLCRTDIDIPRAVVPVMQPWVTRPCQRVARECPTRTVTGEIPARGHLLVTRLTVVPVSGACAPTRPLVRRGAGARGTWRPPSRGRSGVRAGTGRRCRPAHRCLVLQLVDREGEAPRTGVGKDTTSRPQSCGWRAWRARSPKANSSSAGEPAGGTSSTEPVAPSRPPSGPMVMSRDCMARTGHSVNPTVTGYGSTSTCSVCTIGGSSEAVPAATDDGDQDTPHAVTPGCVGPDWAPTVQAGAGGTCSAAVAARARSLNPRCHPMPPRGWRMRAVLHTADVASADAQPLAEQVGEHDRGGRGRG